MKALKSKEMKISQVLQSIVRLFSGPERLHLLEGTHCYLILILLAAIAYVTMRLKFDLKAEGSS